MGDWPAGREFDGYQLIRLLGKGGMGEVHLAHDTLLDRPVAVKFISAPGADEEARRRFLVEARAIARLQHPNVVAIYRVGEVDSCPYLVSEFIRGQALNTLPTPIPSDQALKIGMEISSALAAAHRRGVVHRDIKPANAILSEEGQVKLLDFGIAKLLASPLEGHRPEGPLPPRPASALAALAADSTLPTAQLAQAEQEVAPADLGFTRPGVVMGTPRYMAPEIWRGEPAAFPSDVYSLGALLYSLCAGRPPHTEANVLRLSEVVQSCDALPLAQVAPQVDPALAAIVDRCLRRDPSERYASGNEVRSALAKLTSETLAQGSFQGNPYRGLHAFEAEHQMLFFGRDSEIRMILERLAVETFVLVAGDSGVGKSSLCRSGVLPRLGRALRGDRSWSSITLVPGRHPLTALSVALAPALGQREEDVVRAIGEDPSGVARALRAAQGKASGLVVFIDQMEELLTQTPPSEAAAFSETLGWLMAPAPQVRVLATVRGDFLSRLASLPHLGDEISRALYFLRPLSSERIREAIVGPAQARGVAFESREMVDCLVESTERAEGGLPLLQFALAELWEARGEENATITQAALDALGGVAGALSRHADNVLAPMAPQDLDGARQILLRLVTAEGTRSRKTGAELDASLPHRRAALDALVRGRLIVAKETVEGPAYEIAHEVLTHGWPTLAGWLSADAGARITLDRLRLAAADWERLGRAREMLWSERQLQEARALDRSRLPSAEKGFLEASLRARSRSRLLRLAIVPAILLMGSLFYGGAWLTNRWDLQQRVNVTLAKAQAALDQARSQRAEAQSRRREALALFDQPDLKAGEAAWERYRALAASLQPSFGHVSQLLETALLLDLERQDVRALFAQVLYERALLAEDRRDGAEQEELLRRLALHDGGAGLRRWASPATLTFTAPPGTAIELYRFRPQGHRLVREAVMVQKGAIRSRTLEPGSYLALLSAPGHATVRYPFLLRRQEEASFVVELPRAERVPSGFVAIPPGRFLFGSAAEDGQRRDFFHTVPLHEVTTRGYLIARHETTFGDWLAYLEALPAEERQAHAPRVEKGGFQGALALREGEGAWEITFQPTTQPYTALTGQSLLYPGRKIRRAQDWRRLPVFGIAVADALEYVAWLDRTGRVRGARLCTDQEWERAARGADGREFPHGHGLEPSEANYDNTYGKDPLAIGPDEVGSYPASESPFGLHDMAGNVWEWTRSSLTHGEYAARGGSYYFGLNSARTTDREVTEPSFRDVSVGMRVCADL